MLKGGETDPPPLDWRTTAKGTAIGRGEEWQPFLYSISYTPSPSITPAGSNIAMSVPITALAFGELYKQSWPISLADLFTGA